MPLPLIFIGSGLAVLASTISAFHHRKKSHSKKTKSNQKTDVDIHFKKSKNDAASDLKVSFLSIGTAGFATLFYSPLLYVAAPLVLYNSVSIFHNAFQQWQKKRRIHASAVDSIIIVSMLVSGYYFIATIVVFILHLGQYFSLRTKNKPKQQIIIPNKKETPNVWLWCNGVEIETPFAAVKKGQTIVIHAGEVIPFDGVITKGIATIDQQVINGKSLFEEKTDGDNVFANTRLINGRLHIRVKISGKNILISNKAQQDTSNLTSSHANKHGNNLSNRLAAPTLLLGGAALAIMGPLSATAIITCNFSDVLRVISPLSTLNHLTLAARNNIHINNGHTLDSLNIIDTVIFDAVGTLTDKNPSVTQIYTFYGFKKETVLSIAAAVEHDQQHPFAYAIRQAAKELKIVFTKTQRTHYIAGYGITAHINKKTVLLGNENFMQTKKVRIPKSTIDRKISSHKSGSSLVYLAINGKLAGIIELQAKIRTEVPAMITALQQRGLTLQIISGNQEHPTKQLASELGVLQYQFEISAEEKVQHVKKLQTLGKKVCFIGDGLNDILAMKEATVSLSLADATNIATETANIVFLNKNFKHLDELFEIAKSFNKNTKSGAAWTLLPGIVGLGGILFFHIGIIGAVSLYSFSLGAGTVNATLPLLKKKKNKTNPTPQ